MNQYLTTCLEIKALSKRQFEGHGSIFGNVDLGGDVVVKGAFAGSLKQHKAEGILPQMFWMHSPDKVPGKWIEMSEDDKGLYVKGELAETQLGEEMYTLLNMKAVRGMSIGYRTLDRDYDKEGNRLLKEIELWEVSLVSLAMNPKAQVTGMKSRLSARGEYVPEVAEIKRHLEDSLRDVGYSNLQAKKFVSLVADGLSLDALLDESHRDDGMSDEEKSAVRRASELAELFEIGAAAERLKNIVTA